jgi:lysophospholipase L1-like esterase
MNNTGLRLTFCLNCCLLLLTASASFAQQPPPPVPQISTTIATTQSQPVTPAKQPPPFWDEIAEFKHQDSLRRPPSGAILFVGSSSFRKWSNVQSYFPGYTIINRGFGGSSFPDLIRYANEIIFPYHPKQIVIYCGDNDLAISDSITATMVFNRFVRLYELIRSRLKEVDIVYISIKPSPSRQKLMPKMEETNDLIRDFMAKYSHAVFVDVYHPMLTPTGQPNDSLFLRDNLHMNEKGYRAWQQILLPYLDK